MRRHELVAAAPAEFARMENPIPDTGTLKGDLRVLLAQIVDVVRRPEVERLVRATAALDSAHQPDTEASEVIELLVAPVYLRLLLLDRPLDDALLDRSVCNTLAAYAVGRQ